MPEQPVVLVTGASSGVGRSTARLRAQHGYRALGTRRNPAGAGDTPGVTTLPLDVRSDESVAACLSYNAVRASEEKGPRPELVADTVLKTAGSKTPRLRSVVGQQATFVTRLRRFGWIKKDD